MHLQRKVKCVGKKKVYDDSKSRASPLGKNCQG